MNAQLLNSIALTRGDNCWLATFSGPHAAEVYRLFGTFTMPTAFYADSDAKIVRDEIANRNPGVQVYVVTAGITQ